MVINLYHVVGYLPYSKELVSLGSATTLEEAEEMSRQAVERYTEDSTAPMRHAILELPLVIDHVDTVPVLKKRYPVPAKLADEKHSDIAPFGSHPGRFA